MRKEHKNPKGGLTAKGRAYFKRKAKKKGKQVSKQPKRIAKKTAAYRRFS